MCRHVRLNTGVRSTLPVALLLACRILQGVRVRSTVSRNVVSQLWRSSSKPLYVYGYVVMISQSACNDSVRDRRSDYVWTERSCELTNHNSAFAARLCKLAYTHHVYQRRRCSNSQASLEWCAVLFWKPGPCHDHSLPHHNDGQLEHDHVLQHVGLRRL